MVKEKRILSYFISWLVIGFCIIFIGINNVFAAEYNMNYNYSQKYFDNRGSSVVGVTTTWMESFESYVSDNISTVAGSYGAGLSITSPIPILENHTYTLSIYFVDRNNIALSSKNYLAFSSTLQGAANNYANGEFDNELITSSVSNNSILNFSFTSRRNGAYIFIPWTTTTNVTQNYVLTQIIMEDLGSEGVSINEINSSLNNQTNTLNNSIQNSTDTIINNQNQNNEELKDTINENFNSCHNSYNLFDKSNLRVGYIQTQTGEFLQGGESSATRNIINLPDNTYTVSGAKTVKICYYDESSVFVKCDILEGSNVYTFTLNEYNNIRLQFMTSSIENIMLNVGSTAKPYEPYGEEICSNKIDETNNQLGDLNNSLNNSNSSGATNDASNFFSNFTTDTFGLTSIITAPLSLINKLTSSSCSTLRLPLPYLNNKYLELPCMQTIYFNYFGSFFNIYQSITFGIVAYWVIVRIFNQVKDFKNPDHDEIEVLDL